MISFLKWNVYREMRLLLLIRGAKGSIQRFLHIFNGSRGDESATAPTQWVTYLLHINYFSSPSLCLSFPSPICLTTHFFSGWDRSSPDVWPSWAQYPESDDWPRRRKECSESEGSRGRRCVYMCALIHTYVLLINAWLQLTLQECRATNTCPTLSPQRHKHTHTNRLLTLLIIASPSPTSWKLQQQASAGPPGTRLLEITKERNSAWTFNWHRKDAMESVVRCC